MSPRPWLGRGTVPAFALSLLLLVTAAPAASDAASKSARPRPERAGDLPMLAVQREPTGSPGTPDIAAPPACTTDFGGSFDAPDMDLSGVALTRTGAVVVGFTRSREDGEYSRRRPAALLIGPDGWARTPLFSRGNEDGLVAVASAGGEHAWGVGFTTQAAVAQPLAMHWTGRVWLTDKPAPRGSLTTILTDVTLGRDERPFAVGYRMTADGRRLPLAVDRDQRRWRYLDPPTRRRESIALSGVTADARGRIWAVGSGGPGTSVGPVSYRRDGDRWERLRIPAIRGEAVLSDVVVTDRGTPWAVGYQTTGGLTVPLVLRWDGRTWVRTPEPVFDSAAALLTAVSAPPSGGVWVVGSAWDRELGDYEAIAAWWDGKAWNEVSGPEGGQELHDVAGALDADGWAVGSVDSRGRATRVCPRPQAGLFGGSEPSGPPEAQPSSSLVPASPAPVAADDLQEGPDRDARVPGAPAGAGAGASSGGSTGAAAGSTVVAARKDRPGRKTARAKRARAEARRAAARRAAARRAKRRVPALPPARPAVSVTARDVAATVGLGDSTATYDALTADFDGDGILDLYIGGHGRPGRIMLARDGVFVEHSPVPFPRVDRHGCAAADIDGSGLPDLYCAVGGRRGAGFKANELWIDPGGPAPADAALGAGVMDATGRGRQTEFLRSKTDGVIDLVVTNSPARVDGLPSPSRLYRTRGDGRFAERPRPGYAAGLGALATQSADYDRDGREDLLLVTGGLQAPRSEGTRLYRNGPRGLFEVTRRVGIRPMAEVDAELVDLDADGRLDLVQLAPGRLRVSLWRSGRFVPVYTATLRDGRALASGDADGDGRPDLYIVRGASGGNPWDVLLLTRRGGRAFSSMTIPQVSTGDGDGAVAIDHDDNGLTDFLVLNGRAERGPLQLVAFYPR